MAYDVIQWGMAAIVWVCVFGLIAGIITIIRDK